MIFSLEVCRARKGDCLLLHYGTIDRPRLALIDGGPKSVYGPHLKPRLKAIRDQRGLSAQQPLLLDLVMISHVDDDHIQGVLDLTRELREAAGVPVVQIRRFWHNSFDNIIDRNPQELTAGVAAQFGAASLEGNLPDDAALDVADDEPTLEIARATLKVLASIKQGVQLRRDIDALGVPVNSEAGGKLLLAAKDALTLPGGLRFTIAGPLPPELKKLQNRHDDWLRELRAHGKKPEEVLAAYADRSVPNLSSVVALAQVSDKTILLTGDARGDKILEGLETVSRLEPGGSLHVDVLKVPHHGSANNVGPDFFERITADHYVLSGNGEHGNPARTAIEMLLDARGEEPFTLHLTYPIADIDTARQEEWRKQQAIEKQRHESGRSHNRPRADWSHEKHSLEALFERRPLANGQHLAVVADDAPHVLNLLDPLRI